MKESKLANGRIGVYVPNHPGANNRGYILKSRYLVEQKLGHFLAPDEHVHHKDGNKLHDVIENLEVVAPNKHAHLHRKLDYKKIEELINLGCGYKRISKLLNISIHSAKSACRVIKKQGII